MTKSIKIFKQKLLNSFFGDPWTIEKLQTLKGYLEAYNVALKNQNFNRVYIDGFSGRGLKK